MSDLPMAIRIAAEVHARQVDKAGEPYILHPLRVMLEMPDDLHRIVAVLHDVVEDGDDGWMEIHEGMFSDEVKDAIDAVTRREGEDYFDYVRRAAAHPIGRVVKMADLHDNLRECPADPKSTSRMARYAKAINIIGAVSPLPVKPERTLK